MSANALSQAAAVDDLFDADALAVQVLQRAPADAVDLLHPLSDTAVAQVLSRLNAWHALKVLAALPKSRHAAVSAALPEESARQWARNEDYPEDRVGRLMEPPESVFRPDATVAETVATLRAEAGRTLVTYCYVTDARQQLLGVVTMRDLLLADAGQTLEAIMLRNPYTLAPDMSINEAAREVMRRHYPLYPVCDGGRLVGLVRGHDLFEVEALELSAQAGRMVGIEKEERLGTPWWRALTFRHPWLQLNLFTAFIAAAVVGTFQGTINHVLVLAAFLPVMSGQSANTGCQTLAVTLRGMTLGELGAGGEYRMLAKELLLGAVNGALSGLTAAAGMYLFAALQHNPDAGTLALVVFAAMTASCMVSGAAGGVIPLILRRFGTDPATASSIFLTTATDVVSMGLFLWLATALLMR